MVRAERISSECNMLNSSIIIVLHSLKIDFYISICKRHFKNYVQLARHFLLFSNSL